MKNKLILDGKQTANGEVRISGAKNAGLVIMAASIMAEGETVLDNVPRIRDVDVMLDILTEMGVVCRWNEDQSLSICPPTGNIDKPTPYELSKKLRASNLFLGALMGRQGEAAVSLPGGCDIGTRPMDLHIKGISALGAEVSLEQGNIYATAKQLQGARIYLDFPSVGATENIMMTACRVPGQTFIENAAKEPEIVDLANFLNTMGGRVRGAGTDIIKIEGVPELKAGRYAIIPDRIEAGTYMVAAAISGGTVLLENIIPTHLHPIIAKLQETGAHIEERESSLLVEGSADIRPADIKTLPYPGFPTDMQSQMLALLCRADGTSVVVENVFENRFQIVDEFKRMGAQIKVKGMSAIVQGVPQLNGSTVKATDLRAGAALILMALAAEGRTVIEEANYIFRGYEDIVNKFAGLGVTLTAE
ncbi:MAG: UDP-N-acetylglucosamine 1-carboxyvinyltransferase [Syntrophomonadaceae bacterium]|nr:UDP-N-acetylglucosamine 1-carboxyvinyltransferase [Syntrophomonadaceae bacterium]